MLLAAFSASRHEEATALIAKAAITAGVPALSFHRGRGALAAWENPAGVRASFQRGLIAVGALDLDQVEISGLHVNGDSGDFAMFGIRDDGLLLATGRAGGYRPMFVASPSRDTVVACTEISPLLAMLPHKPPLDVEHLCDSILSHSPQSDSTHYRGIQRVPYEEAWLVRPGTAPTRSSTGRPLFEPELRDDNELPGLLRSEIAKATSRAARGARRPGVAVSGGLDSSLILSLLVCLARDRKALPPEAIACEYQAPAWGDDRPFIRLLEHHLGLRIHRAEPDATAASLRTSMVIDAMPTLSPLVLSSARIGTIARGRGVDVMIAGDGGDTLLDGDPRLFGELARQGHLLRAVNGALKTRGVFYHGSIGRFLHYLLGPMVAPLVPAGVTAAARDRRDRALPAWAGPELARHARGASVETVPAPSLREAPDERYSRFIRAMRFGWGMQVRLQEEMLGGYSVRVPLIDDDLVRFTATVPPLALMRGGYLRGLMREAMRGLVPEDIRLRQTKGKWWWFLEQTFASAGGLEVFSDLANVVMQADLGLIKPKAFRALFSEACRDPASSDYETLWRILSVEAFLRAYAGSHAPRPS